MDLTNLISIRLVLHRSRCISERSRYFMTYADSYCHSSRMAMSNRTRHKAQYGYGMTHDHVRFLSFYNQLRGQLFRSRRLHHLHHFQRRERCRVRPNFIRVFEVKLPPANFLSLSLSLSNAPLNNDFGKQQRATNERLRLG